MYFSLPCRLYAPNRHSVPYSLLPTPKLFVIKPHIVIIIPRGEAARNFVYSDTLPILAESARVTLLSVIDDPRFTDPYRQHIESVIPIKYTPENRMLGYFRSVLHEAHFRWMDTVVARNKWETLDAEARTTRQKVKRFAQKAAVLPVANRPALEMLSRLENRMTVALRNTRRYDELYRELKPDLVFNGSHIHGNASILPVRMAKHLGIPVAGFVFSWDNLTNRSRIFEPYDHYVVWHEHMRNQLLGLYPFIPAAHVHVTGTPQFDFHFKDEYVLSREELCGRIGVDPARPFILYTTGVDRHFPDEHLHVREVIDILHEMDPSVRPQLVVRTYVKGTSVAMKQLAAETHADVVFPPVQWEEKWFTPAYEDLSVYTSLVHHAAMSINAASTVSLEFLMFGKPVMNIGFDPPGSALPHHLRWHRHIEFDHYAPVAASGAVMVAMSVEDMRKMITEGLSNPEKDAQIRKEYIASVFGNTLDGQSGRRVAECLLTLAGA